MAERDAEPVETHGDDPVEGGESPPAVEADRKRPLLILPIRDLKPFLGYVWYRFGEDRCTTMASSLSYTSLLAIVPLTAIAFAMLAAFPVFEGVREQFQSVLFSNFLPQSAEAMQDYFDQFIRNTGQLTAVGIIGLALTAVLLLGTIESNLNSIFRVIKPRALVPRLLVFWALLTLGPLLLGASFSLSTYFFAATEWTDQIASPIGGFTQFLPTLMVVVALWMFYVIIPNRPVRLVDALIGGIVAGLMFAILRKVFGYYVASFPTYQTIYGAVSAVPIFLIWMYLSWTVVLFGAEITAGLGEWWVAGGRPEDQVLRSGRRLTASLRVLHLLARASHDGAGVTRARLLEGSGLAETSLERVLARLKGAGYAEQTVEGAWVAVRDLHEATMYDLLCHLELDLKFPEEWATRDGVVEPWEQRLLDITRANADAQGTLMGITLKALLDDGDGEGEKAEA